MKRIVSQSTPFDNFPVAAEIKSARHFKKYRAQFIVDYLLFSDDYFGKLSKV